MMERKLEMGKRVLSVLLLMALVLTSCGGAVDDGGKESSAPSDGETSGSESVETGETRAHDELGDVDMGGREFTVLAREETRFEFDTEQDGELEM